MTKVITLIDKVGNSRGEDPRLRLIFQNKSDEFDGIFGKGLWLKFINTTGTAKGSCELRVYNIPDEKVSFFRKRKLQRVFLATAIDEDDCELYEIDLSAVKKL